MTFSNNSLSPTFADRAYTYKVTASPATTPISLAEVKAFAKITTTADDALITMMIESATDYAEKFTRRDFITRTYKTFRDNFPNTFLGSPSSNLQNSPFNDSGNFGFELRRSPLQSIESVQYTDTAGATIVIPTTVYYAPLEDDYSSLLTQIAQSWPSDALEQLQAITIEFKTGFGDNAADVPSGIRQALLMHTLFLYDNRGDCGCDDESIPQSVRRIYLQNRIENL
tara:strand:- start:15382 stop:16062 length:681 start_codon:yes stop_codon:yes gene_type:complete